MERNTEVLGNINIITLFSICVCRRGFFYKYRNISMNKWVYFLIGTVGVLQLTYFILKNNGQEYIFGLGIDNRIYNLIWAVIVFLSFRKFYYLNKDD